MKYISLSYVVLLCTILIGCGHQKPKVTTLYVSHKTISQHQSLSIKNNETPTIVVWVHGTRFLTHRFQRDIFNGNAALKPITECLLSDMWIPDITERIYKSLSDDMINNTYIFGWSGKLSAQERKNASKILYHELLNIYHSYYTQYHTRPHIRIISHSHGGNVVLNLASIKDHDCPFSIDEVIMLACPVQQQTQHLIHDPLFKSIYTISSSFDIVQILAPQIIYTARNWKIPSPSFRLFTPCSKIVQAKLRLNGRPILHGEFTSSSFLKILDIIVEHLQAEHEKQAVIPYHLLSLYTI